MESAAPCKRHPSTSTRLACGRCDTPICPKCAVRSPVGMKCPDCIKLTVPEVYRIGWVTWLRVIVIVTITAVAMGLLHALVSNLVGPHLSRGIFTGLLTTVLVVFSGAVIGTVTSYARGRKLMPQAPLVAGVGVIVSFTLGIVFTYILFGVGLRIAFLLNTWALIFTLIGLFIAVTLAARRAL